MQFQLTKELLDQLSQAIEQGNDRMIADLLKDWHAADIAEVINELDEDDGKYLFKLIEQDRATETLLELDEDVREELLESLTTKEIAAHLNEMDSDDAADVVAELPEEKKKEVISQIEDKEQASDIEALLIYPEDTAGGIMAREFIKANVNWPVDRCVVEMRRQAQEVEHVYTIYVVDDHDVLLGLLSLKALLFANPKTRIEDLYQKNVKYIQATASAEDAANLMEKYDLVVLPVVDENERLVGRITIDDVVDVIKEEAEKDYSMATGLSEMVESSDTVWVISKARLPWLFVGLVGGICSAQVIARYEGALQINPSLAYFIPLIAAMGGNVGVQSSAIVVQGLANKSVSFEGIFRRLTKELVVGLINGLILALALFGASYFLNDGMNLGVTVSLSLLAVIVFASIFGTFVPIALDKYKIDPALATGPFITTMNDILGIFIYFTIGHLMYIS